MNEQSEDKCDRELFSELLEPPIHPLLIHIVPPFIEKNNPVFTLQMNGEAAWRLREIYWPPQKVFELFQTSIMPLGYRLTESSRDRVGRTIGENIRRFKRRMETITNGKKRKQFRSETWINITINPEEIEQSPNDTIAQLTEENSHLRATVEDQAAELYDAMRERLAHKGKDFTDVGKKQQHRHLTQIK